MTTKELTEVEKRIFYAVDNNEVALLQAALIDNRDVNIFNESLITPLQHAAYRGNKDTVQLLLDHGADPNLCGHEYGYTALHFAALSANTEVCILLLVSGAKPDTVNTLGRTAAQMAAFVGNYACVATINNFVPKIMVETYTVSEEGLVTKPPLPAFLSESFHKFIMTINMHPVRVALNLQSIVGLAEHMDEVRNVLDLMSKKWMKGREINEVLSFKFYYLGYIVETIMKIRKNKDGDEKTMDIFEIFTRKLLKPNKDGQLECMDTFLKENVREFPFWECMLFRQIITSITGPNRSSVLGVISAAINGQRGFSDDAPVCDTCGEENPAKKCSKCKVVQYCDRDCQRLHWFVHKKTCARLSVSQEHPKITEPSTSATIDATEISKELENLRLAP